MPRALTALALALAALPLAALGASAQTACDPSYPTLCLQPAYVTGDLDCVDVGATWFTVLPPDPHGFDADYDGYGCEA